MRLQTSSKDYLLSKLSIKTTPTEWARDISDIAKEDFGRVLNHTEKIRIGTLLKKKYVQKFKQIPDKTRRWVNGSMRLVNSYKKEHEQLITELIKQHI